VGGVIKSIWNILSLPNFLPIIKLIKLVKFIKIKTIEKYVHANNYKKPTLLLLLNI